MKTINSSDVIFATVTQRGNTLYDGQMSGMSSMAEVMSSLRGALAGAMGMLTLTLRNGTQGWSSRSSIKFAMAEGVQLSLF